jgi:hypothetical protein
MNNLLITSILIFTFFFSFGQTKKINVVPTKVDEKTKVRNYVINQIKNSLEFPKYYKTEKINIDLTFKGKPTNIAYCSAENKVGIDEKPKYFTNNCIEKEKIYKIEKLECDTEYKSFTVFYKKNNFVIDSFVYDEPNTDIEFFTKQTFIKYLDSEYEIKIWYWAMSRGGTIRLYNDSGTAYVDKKGTVIFIIKDKPEE